MNDPATDADAFADDEAVEAAFELAQLEGIIPALESAHAIADCMKVAPTMGKEEIILVNLSGRGDKDLGSLRKASPGRFGGSR